VPAYAGCPVKETVKQML